MAGEWERLADYIREGMEEHGFATQKDLADAAGVGDRMVYDLLTGRDRDRMPRKITKVERALNWRPGTARRIVNGENPSSVDSDARGPREELWRLVRGLTEDELETFLTEYLEYLASRRRNPV